jgi:hypothetical protein
MVVGGTGITGLICAYLKWLIEYSKVKESMGTAWAR